ncbi:hypothetical protein VN1172_04450 [Helicobacter pylori]|nr:hypothetical protein VN1172_04450 [Helicobacter pylori]
MVKKHSNKFVSIHGFKYLSKYKIQTLAPFSLDIEKVLFLWDFYGIQEKYTKKTLAKP